MPQQASECGQRRAPLAGLQATQRGDIDARALGNIGQCEPSLAGELAQALPDAKVDAF